jgi:3-deoxy-D-manno-octulosonic-acid transferase
MGEVLAVGDLLADLRKARPDLHLLVTTTTATGGFAVTRAVPGALHQFLPADIPKAVAGFLDHWRPDAAIIVESDIWPRLVTVSSARSIPLALVNARPSRTRLRLPRSMGALLSRFSLVTTQDVKVTQEILSLGVSEESVVTAKRTALTRMIGDRSLWSAVSTHPADEGAVLAAHAALRQRRPDALLLLVPRHPARGEAIISACAAQGLSSARRSLGESVTTDTAVYLCDTVGETGVFFRLARIVFLGGSFGKEGGHNPFEPLSLGAAVLHGPRVRHFSASYARFDAAGASKVVADATALESAVDAWLRDPAHLDRAVAAGRCSLTEMPGAREITLTSLLALLDRHA